MDDQFNDLQRLLRLKRHEAPPTEYFEDFLWEFHRRQRSELLRRPLWRLALDRLEGAIPSLTPARYAYAGSCAAMLVVTVLVSAHNLTGSTGTQRRQVTLVSTDGAPTGSVTPQMPRFAFHTSRAAVGLPELNFDRPRQYTVSSNNVHPRYVLDTQPVSYEPSSSF